MSGVEDIEAYLAKLSEPEKSTLEHLRNLIRAAAPDATEAMVYGVPGFRLNKKGLVCYAAFKDHFGFYPMVPAVIDQFARELEGRSIAKGTIRFTTDDPLPDDLITRMVQARVANIREKG